MGSLGPEIAKKIRHLLAKNNLSQAEFSRLTDIVGPQLSKYLTGKNTPGLDQLERMAVALGISVSSLLSDEMPETAPPRKPTAEEMALAIFDSLGIEGTRGELIRFILEHEDVNYEFYLDAMKSPSGPAAVPGSDNGEPELA